MTKTVGLLALILSALIFGFFYAWVCSTMWGLDRLDPATAIAAMNAMNGSVRNGVFAPAFFGTAPALLVAAIVARHNRPAALLFGLAAVTYALLGVGITASVNAPMNAELARTAIPDDPAQAQQIWTAYSSRWQTWNQIRALGSGLAFILAALGFARLK